MSLVTDDDGKLRNNEKAIRAEDDSWKWKKNISIFKRKRRIHFVQRNEVSEIRFL